MRRYFAALMLVVVLAACASHAATSTPPLPSTRWAVAGPFLYVASASGGVSVYALGNTVPLRTLSADLPTAIAFDRFGNLYVANQSGGPSGRGYVTVFTPGSYRAERVISTGVSAPYSLAFDAKGNLYVANYLRSAGAPKLNNGSVTVYKPNASKPFRTITSGLDHPRQILIAGNGDLVVVVRQRVRFYAPGSTVPTRTVRAIDTAIGLDGRKHIFVGNGQGCPNYCFGNVDVYVPWKTKPVAYYSLDDLDEPGFLPTAYAFDLSGYVYMALSDGQANPRGRVAVYPPLPKHPAHALYYLDGLEMTGPRAIVLDPSDNVIVGNNGAVDAYVAHTQTLSYTITQGVSGQVTALAIASQ